MADGLWVENEADRVLFLYLAHEPDGSAPACSLVQEFTYCYHMSEALLLETVATAALEAGKTLRVLERRAQSPDHPILINVAETLYLKCLILQVLSL